MAKSTSPSTTRKPLARSAACLSNRLHELVSACFSGLWITTAEPTEATRPTVVLDVDALLGSLVGQSESNVRAALKLAKIKQHPFCKSGFSKVGHLASMFR
jgi:hypothetical protein